MWPQETSKLTRAKQTLDELIKIINKRQIHRKSQLKKVWEKTAQIETKVKAHFWEAVQYILSEDRRLIKELNVQRDSQLNKLHADIDSDYKLLRCYKGQLELINQTLEMNSEGDRRDIEEVCKSVDKIYGNSHSPEHTPLDEIKFVYDSEMLLESIKNVSHEIVTIPVNACQRKPSPVLKYMFSTRTSDDITDPDIRNVTVIRVKGLKITVVTDWNNKCIKSFYKERNRTAHSVLVTGGSPFGVTNAGDETVFVTDPGLKKILNVSVHPELRTVFTISTEKMYCGIASLGNSRLISSGYEWSNTWASFWTIDILDTDGNSLKTIRDRVLQSPEYICASSSGKIVASDKGTRSLIYLSSEGDEYLTVTPTGENLIRLPQGITVTDSGNVLLVDTMANKVTEMTDTGEIIRDLLTAKDGLDKPRGITIDGKGCLHVTCGEHVKVYDITTHSGPGVSYKTVEDDHKQPVGSKLEHMNRGRVLSL